ncbi:MAG: DUF2914 domain-containing protein [Myxococcota bacterium]
MKPCIPFVMLLTVATMAFVGCDKPSKEPGPLARASKETKTLASTKPNPIPSAALAKPIDAAPKDDPKHKTTDFKETETSLADAHPEPVEDGAHAIDDEPEHFEPEPFLDGDDGLVVQRLMTAPSIEAREPVAPTSFFVHEEKVVAFLDVANASEADKTLTVFFIAPSGKATGGVELSIPANKPRWRTWAYTEHTDEVGLWRVEVRSESGSLVAAVPFEVSGGC